MIPLQAPRGSRFPERIAPSPASTAPSPVRTAPSPVRSAGASRTLRAARELFDLIVPTWCAGCAHPDVSCCERCIAELVAPPTVRWLQLSDDAELLVLSAGAYEGTLRTLILAVKDHGRLDALPALAALFREPVALLAEVLSDPAAPIVLVPLPSRPAAVRRRGYRHVDLLVRAALQRGAFNVLGMPQLQPWLRLARGRPQRALGVFQRSRGQVGLSADERQRNRRGTMRVRSRVSWRFGRAAAGRECLAGKRVILLDDIVTTGASLREAHRVCVEAGATVLAALCLGDTPKRGAVRDSGVSGIL